MSNSFLDGIGEFFTAASGSNDTTASSCVSDIDHYKFYQFSLIPAVVLTILMASTKKRRKKLMSFLDGRPGLVFPMDALTRSSRVSYCCAFGATGFLVYQILIEQKFAVDYQGPISLKSLIAVLSMFVYGMVFFPVFTCLALGTAFSYALGSLYIWMFFIIEVYRLTECNFTAEGKALLLVRALPSLLCLGYLSLSLPARFCISCYKRKFFVSDLGEEPYSETLEDIRNSYQGRHVRKLLRKPEVPQEPEGVLANIKATIMNLVSKWIYKRERGFRYPSRLMSVMFIAACVVYVITVETMVQFVLLLDHVMDVLEYLLDMVGWDSQPGEDEGVTYYRDGLKVSFWAAHISKVSLIVAVTLAVIISLLTILHMLSSFRTNLYAMYRADYRHIPPPSEKSAVSLCISSIKYAGFQVAYIVWAYIITAIILFLVCLALAGIITLLREGVTDWLVNRVLQIWPGVVIALALLIIQNLLAKFFFLQDRGQHLRLDNRRFYFVFTYFMFFYNIFLGLISCLLRIIKAVVVGTIFLARLDNSTLPRKFEFLDPGFNAYQGYIHLETAHTHPVVLVFIRLLVSLSRSRKGQQNGGVEIEMDHYNKSDLPDGKDKTDEEKRRPVNVAARFNWQVIYTLLHNPTVRIYRKGFIQALKRAQKEGLKIPISDKPFSDLDIIKAQEEKEREKEQEKEASKGQKESTGLVGGLTAISNGLGTSPKGSKYEVQHDSQANNYMNV